MKTIPLSILIAVAGATVCLGQADSSPTANPSAPPSAPPQRSEADLEKLVAPIALYPDPLLASLLPASAYPIEIVQAARFVKDTNNISQVDSQPWDQSVKAIAHFPDVLQKMNDDISWTSDLGEAFVQDQKGVMNAIQAMRDKAQQAGSLKTTPQQVVTVTNNVVQQTVDQQVVYVTNTEVQIQPAQPDVIYVPQYNPAVVYAAPYPGYVAPGYVAAASVISFGAGMAVGAVLANNCNWHSGGVYVGGGGVWAGGYHGNVNVNRNVNVNQNYNRNYNYGQNNYNRNNFNQNNVNRNNFNQNNFNQNNLNRNNLNQNNLSQNNLNRNNLSQNNLSQNNLNRSGLNQTANAQKWQPNPSRASTYASSTPQSRGWGGGTSSSGQTHAPSATGFSSSSFSGGHSGFSSSGGGAQTRMASSRGASSWGGGGGFHGGGGGRR